MATCFRCGQIDSTTESCPQCGRTLATLVVKPLQSSSMLSFQQLAEARSAQEREGGSLGSHLVSLGFIDEATLTDFLSEQYGVPAVHLDEFSIEQSVINLFDDAFARRHAIIPVNVAGTALVVALADPSDIFAIDEAKAITGFNIEVVVTSPSQVARALSRYYGE